MRGMLFISFLLGMFYLIYLQMEDGKQHDLDKAQNQVEQVQEEVDQILEDYQNKLNENLNNI